MDRTYSFGYWIRRRRKALDLTQEELARQVACGISMIKKIELDQRRPSRPMAERLAECLEIPISERARFIQVALAMLGPDRLALEKEPLSLDTTSTINTNLPLPATRLVGRQEQITGILELLHNPEVRMLTLAGPGGVGKTRLALHIATYLFPEFPDGCWLVELAPLSNPALVAQEVLSSLGLHESSPKSPLLVLSSYLRKKNLLLLLDNCEHLLDACAHLAHALLSECKDLVVLCTSREALNIPEEYTWLVPPLALPDLNTFPALDDVSQVESVSLFLDRTVHVQPSFQLTEQNASAIAKICCRLDGLPLAIELAAARMRALSPEQISEKLDDAIRLLDSGYRTADARQQTMRAAIEWSYNTLSIPERVLWRRLSVFIGGWSLSAAESVCAGAVASVQSGSRHLTPLLQPADIINLLSKLVSKSMVTVSSSRGQEQHYHSLETLRQHAAERLFEAGEMESMHLRHLEYFLGWVEAIAPGLHGPEQIALLHSLDIELENLRQALTWSVSHAPVAGLRLASALYRFWRVRNLYAEGLDWLLKLLNCPENSVPTAYRAHGLGILSSLGLYQSPQPEAWAGESLAISESLGDDHGRAFALWMLGSISYLRHEDFIRGREQLTASLEAYQHIGDRWGMAQVLYHLANLAIYQGDAITQQNLLEQSLALYRDVGDLRGIAAALDNLASAVADIDADLLSAQAMVEEAIAVYRRLDARSSMHNALYVYASILAWQGQYSLARGVLLERLEIVRQSGAPMNIILAEVLVASLDRLAGDEETALHLLEESLRTMQASDPRLRQGWHYARTLHELAYILARRGDTTRARSLLQEAFEVCAMPEEHIYLLHCRGLLGLVEGNGTAALEDLKLCLEICQSSHFKLNAILAIEGIAAALNLRADQAEATRMLASAARFRREIAAPVSPWDQPVHAHLLDELQTGLGQNRFDTAWAGGSALPFEQAITEALAYPS